MGRPYDNSLLTWRTAGGTTVADRDSAGPQVLVLGWLTDVSGAITAALGRSQIAVKHAHPPVTHKTFRQRWRTTESAAPPLSAAEIDSIESVIAIFDGHTVRARFGGRQNCASRRRLRVSANEACDSTTAAALTVGARRVLLICDARRLPGRRRAHAASWTRDLAHRIGYECSVNGLPDNASYAVIESDAEVTEIADVVVGWHDSDGPGWPLRPAPEGTVTSASSAPRPHRPS